MSRLRLWVIPPLLILGLMAAAFPTTIAPASSGPAEAAACEPYADVRATGLPSGHYLIAQSSGNRRVVEVHEESNGIPGLQITSQQACGAAPDLRRAYVCATTRGEIGGNGLVCPNVIVG